MLEPDVLLFPFGTLFTALFDVLFPPGIVVGDSDGSVDGDVDVDGDVVIVVVPIVILVVTSEIVAGSSIVEFPAEIDFIFIYVVVALVFSATLKVNVAIS